MAQDGTNIALLNAWVFNETIFLKLLFLYSRKLKTKHVDSMNYEHFHTVIVI